MIQNLSDQSIVDPTPVQDAVIPAVNAGKDALVCAETGSGKTLAYLLPEINRLSSNQQLLGTRCPHALILVPTRELAIQINKEIEWLAVGTGARAVLLTGGQEFRYQASLLRRNPEIVVATPGRLAEHLSRQTLALDEVQYLVLDEADRMLDMGFRDDVLAIASRIQAGHQTLMLSATLKHGGISRIAGELLSEPELVQLSSPRAVNTNVSLQMILADDDAHKLRLLTWLLSNRQFAKALVFANTRETVERISGAIQQHGYDVRFLHGEIPQDARRKIMNGYREGRFNVLVATDVAARGLDVSGLDLVINFDMAHSGEEFVHRAGRTGRAGETGVLISLVTANEWNLSAGIQRYLSVTFDKVKVAGLEAAYKGPKKLKSSGKAVGPKKKKTKTVAGKTPAKGKPGTGKKVAGQPAPAGRKTKPHATKPNATKPNGSKPKVNKKIADQGMSTFKRPPSQPS